MSTLASSGPLLVAVVAMADNGVIGRDNALPWHLPDDLKRFKALTMGRPVLMGRRTHESIGVALPGRDNLVLTRDWRWSAPGCRVVHSLEEAMALAVTAGELMLIGGAEVYCLAWPRVDRIELTQVHGEVDGNVTLDCFDAASWCEVARELHPADERHAVSFSFVTLERRAS